MEIRKFKPEDIDCIINLWLSGNLDAHNFVDSSYWNSNLMYARDAIQSAEVYVCEISKKIVGFIGLSEQHIEGIFVDRQFRSRGIGKNLLNFVKQKKNHLSLCVYEKNNRAVGFYEREDFLAAFVSIDDVTGEREIHMEWIDGN